MESKDSSEDNGGPQEASVDVPHGSDSKTEENDAGMSKMKIPKMCLRKRKSKSLSREMKIRFKALDLHEL